MPDTLTDAQLREGLALADKASPRPWKDGDCWESLGGETRRFRVYMLPGFQSHEKPLIPFRPMSVFDGTQRNMDYILHACNNYPALAREVLELRRELNDFYEQEYGGGPPPEVGRAASRILARQVDEEMLRAPDGQICRGRGIPEAMAAEKVNPTPGPNVPWGEFETLRKECEALRREVRRLQQPPQPTPRNFTQDDILKEWREATGLHGMTPNAAQLLEWLYAHKTGMEEAAAEDRAGRRKLVAQREEAWARRDNAANHNATLRAENGRLTKLVEEFRETTEEDAANGVFVNGVESKLKTLIDRTARGLDAEATKGNPS